MTLNNRRVDFTQTQQAFALSLAAALDNYSLSLSVHDTGLGHIMNS